MSGGFSQLSVPCYSTNGVEGDVEIKEMRKEHLSCDLLSHMWRAVIYSVLWQLNELCHQFRHEYD